jgi:hypothetical protein
MALLPLVLFAVAAAARHGGGRRIAAAALPAALLAVTHVLTAGVAAATTFLWVAVDAAAASEDRWRNGRRAAGRFAVTWALAGGAAAFYAVPFVAERGFTQLAAFTAPGSPTRASLHGVTAGELLHRRPWTDLRPSLPLADGEPHREDMPLYVGAVLFSLLPLACRRPGSPQVGPEPAQVGSAALPPGLAAAAVATLALSLHPIAGWTAAVAPPFDSLLFAWRWLTVATCCLAAAAGFATLRLLERGGRLAALAPAAIAGLLLLDAGPFAGAAAALPAYDSFGYLRTAPGCPPVVGCFEHQPLPPPHPLRVAGLFVPPPRPEARTGLVWFGYPEYVTPAAARRYLSPLEPRRLAAAGAGALALAGDPLRRLRPAPYARWRGRRAGASWQERSWQRGAGEIRVLHDGRPGVVEVLEQYFPGWQVETRGGWREVEPGPGGLLRAPVRRGQREVHFRFHEWRWDRSLGWLLSAAGAATIVLLHRRGRHGRREEAPAS